MNKLFELLEAERPIIPDSNADYDIGYNNGLVMAQAIALKHDTVPVVRCKDCKHFVQGEPYDPCECMKWTVKFGVAYTPPDGYCHKAERKDENP